MTNDENMLLATALQCRREAGGTKDSSSVLPQSSMAEACLPARLIGFTVAESKEPLWTKRFDALKVMIGSGFISAFVGPCGTGKSQLAVSLAKYAMHHGKTALMTEALELCANVKDTFGGDESSRQVMYRYLRPSLLVIDEVNRGLSAFDISLLQRVISKRHDAATQDTILISNETISVFAGLIGERVVSRINDTGEVREFTWASFRR